MSKGKKSKPAQLSMFTAGEELPIFTGGVYGSGVAPFVQREEGKQGAMFAVTFEELAEAAAKKKAAKGKR